ncbi:MAG: hypothetical protein Q9169_008355 [Polycauliona sp. 2 TL-2023]
MTPFSPAAFSYNLEDKEYDFSGQTLEEQSFFFDQSWAHTASPEANEFDFPDLFTDGETLTDSTSDASSHSRYIAPQEQAHKSLSKTAFLPQNYQPQPRRERLQPVVSGLELFLDIEGQANRRPRAADPPHSAPATITSLPLRRKPRFRTSKTSTLPTKQFQSADGHLDTMIGSSYDYKHESPQSQEWTHGMEHLSLHSETSQFPISPSTVTPHHQNGSVTAFQTPRHMTLRDEFFHGERIDEHSFDANPSIDSTDEHFDPFQTHDNNLHSTMAPHQLHQTPSWAPAVSTSSEATYILSSNHGLPESKDSYYTHGLASKSAPALPYQLNTQFSIENFGASSDTIGPLLEDHLPISPPPQHPLHSYPEPPALPLPELKPSHSPPRRISSPALPTTPSRASHHQQHRRSKSTVATTPRRKSASTLRAPKSSSSMSMGFVNFTPHDSKRILTGVAPSGSSKTKARRELEANEKKRKLSAAVLRALEEAGGDTEGLRREGLLMGDG